MAVLLTSYGPKRGTPSAPDSSIATCTSACPGTAGSPLERALQPPSYLYFELIGRLKTTLENGATTARDLMGIDVGVRKAVADGLIAGPRPLVAITC